MNDILKHLSLFVAGKGYSGDMQDFTPPVLENETVDWRGGGMAGKVKIKMGLAPLSSKFSLVSYDLDVLSLFGVQQGATLTVQAKGVLESSDGTQKGIVHTMKGEITKLDQGTFKPGELTPLQVEMDLTYYRLEHSDQVVHEIDLVNMVYVLEGTDRLANVRNLLGQ